MFVGPHSDWQIWRPLVAPGGSRRVMAMLMRRSALSESRPVPRRGLSRYEAAMYLGISASKFDELVRDGRMPAPKRIDSRKVWDVHQLDLAFDSLPDDNDQGSGNSFDDAWVRGEHS
jgi:predicted DNA-binding transcriptional regulator AlpA